MEGYPHPEEICAMLVFHDMGECRIGDIHKVGKRYTHTDETTVIKDQIKRLQDAGEKIFTLWKQMETRETPAGIIAKDADLLELAATACEYKAVGYHAAEDWLINTEKRLQTISAKKLFDALRKTDPASWWAGLKKI